MADILRFERRVLFLCQDPALIEAQLGGRELSRGEAGKPPSVGDLAYYAPWGNLAMFYTDAPYARGLLPLGRIDSSMDVLRAAPASKVTIERAPE